MARPSRSKVSKACFTAASSATSKAAPRARTPADASCATAASTADAWRLLTTTVAPACARPSASAWPMPRVEPVTSAVRPLRSNSAGLLTVSMAGMYRMETGI